MSNLRAWRLPVSKRLVIVVIAVCLALLMPAVLHYRLVQQKRCEDLAKEQQLRLEALRKEEEAAWAQLEKRAASLQDSQRVRQLYEEIDQLMRASERVSEWGVRAQVPETVSTRAKGD